MVLRSLLGVWQEQQQSQSEQSPQRVRNSFIKNITWNNAILSTSTCDTARWRASCFMRCKMAKHFYASSNDLWSSGFADTYCAFCRDLLIFIKLFAFQLHYAISHCSLLFFLSSYLYIYWFISLSIHPSIFGARVWQEGICNTLTLRAKEDPSPHGQFWQA